MKRLIFYILICSVCTNLFSQNYTKGDSLRGNLSSLRNCYDVFFYDLDIHLDLEKKIINESSNTIYFKANNDFNKIQIDLFSNLKIISIEFEGLFLEFSRDYNAFFIEFPRKITEGELLKLKCNYSGTPQQAKNPPWDGGFSWEKDINNNDWIGVSCQGLGASSWWPCKDHQSDEPDSMKITCTTNKSFPIISNGNLMYDSTFINNDNQKSRVASWFVSYPINNYNVTLNIGDYINFRDKYISGPDTLDLDYYVLSYNKDKAYKHFEQVKPMLKCFEFYFGPYPFLNDGYALVETSYLGMEHQSAIAYGNNYLPGYNGNTKYISNLDFDFIIVHETGHEWWGNCITSNDIADMWIHEGFCTYSEVLYVECLYGYDKMLEYVNNQKKLIRNDKPILGDFHVNCKGSGDMYSKGSLMLHTLRSFLDNDSIWFNALKGVFIEKSYSTIDGKDIVKYFNSNLNIDLTIFFKQYLEQNSIPEFEYKLKKTGRNTSLIFKWNAIDGFDMPIIVSAGLIEYKIYPKTSWQEINLGEFDPLDFRIRDDLFYVNVKKI